MLPAAAAEGAGVDPASAGAGAGVGVAAADEHAAAINAAPSARPANDSEREVGRMVVISPAIGWLLIALSGGPYLLMGRVGFTERRSGGF